MVINGEIAICMTPPYDEPASNFATGRAVQTTLPWAGMSAETPATTLHEQAGSTGAYAQITAHEAIKKNKAESGT